MGVNRSLVALMANALCVGVSTLLPSKAMASVPASCWQVDWEAESTGFTSTPNEFNELLFSEVFIQPPPSTGNPECNNYRFSDISRIDFNVVFEGSAGWSHYLIGSRGGGSIRQIVPEKQWLSSQIESVDVRSDPAGGYEFYDADFPIGIELGLYRIFDFSVDYKVVEASVRVSGTHYYYVPGPLPVLSIPVAFLQARKLRRRLRLNTTQQSESVK
jgi:hypothetical protein